MRSLRLVHLMLVTFAILTCGNRAYSQNSERMGITPDAEVRLTLAKADNEKSKAKAAPKKRTTKDKNGVKSKKTASSKEKAPGKAKAKPKTKEAGKSLKAQSAPAKIGKKKAGAAAAATTAAAADDDFYDDDSSASSADAGFWFMLALGILAVCGVGFMLWMEYRPTIYPSGKTYGPFDYLPAGRGGAFTTEYGADPLAQWNREQRPAERGHQQPATITREPLHSTRKSEQVPRTKESA